MKKNNYILLNIFLFFTIFATFSSCGYMANQILEKDREEFNIVWEKSILSSGLEIKYDVDISWQTKNSTQVYLYRDSTLLTTLACTMTYKNWYYGEYTDQVEAGIYTYTIKDASLTTLKSKQIAVGEIKTIYSLSSTTTDSSIELYWNISDNSRIYVCRDGDRIGSSTTGHYSDTTAVPETLYEYHLEDSDGDYVSNTIYESLPLSDNNDNLVSSDRFFWGCWINMSTGIEYTIGLKYLTISDDETAYVYESSTSNTLVVRGIGTFNKETDKVIELNDIPYFRKGGVNLEYNLTLVGLESSRAAATTVGGKRVKGTSKDYGVTEESLSDDGGNVVLHSPVAGDVQTVTVENGSDIITVNDIIVNNSGDNLGKILLADANSYSLKVTGVISNSQKYDGKYLLASHSYSMVVTIENISSNVEAKSSWAVFTPSDSSLSISSTDKNLSGFAVTTLQPGAKRTININVTCNSTIDKDYVDTGIEINITNASTGQVWSDYIPLRIYRQLVPISITAYCPDGNSSGSATLKGFAIYPDGNSQYFSVNHNARKTILLPSFGEDKNYTLVFSGATTSLTEWGNSEMFYRISPYSTTVGNAVEDLQYMQNKGSPTEDSAQVMDSEFESYIDNNTVAYWKIPATTSQSSYTTIPSISYSDGIVSWNGLPQVSNYQVYTYSSASDISLSDFNTSLLSEKANTTEANYTPSLDSSSSDYLFVAVKANYEGTGFCSDFSNVIKLKKNTECALLTVCSQGTYYFTNSDDGNEIWTSNNHGISSSTANSEWSFYLNADNSVYVHYKVSSETNYDKFTLKIDETTAASNVSGSANQEVGVSLKSGLHYIEASYSKDGSADGGDDEASVQVILPCYILMDE